MKVIKLSKGGGFNPSTSCSEDLLKDCIKGFSIPQKRGDGLAQFLYNPNNQLSSGVGKTLFSCIYKPLVVCQFVKCKFCVFSSLIIKIMSFGASR